MLSTNIENQHDFYNHSYNHGLDENVIKVLFISESKRSHAFLEECLLDTPNTQMQVTFSKGKLEAVQMLDDESFDVCILDRHTLVGSIQKTIQSVREHNELTAIILLEDEITKSSYINQEDMEVDGCIPTKGLTPLLGETVIMSCIHLKTQVKKTLFQSIGDTLGAISYLGHEVKTPLCSVLGFSEILLLEAQGKDNNKKEIDYLEYILDSGKNISKILANVQCLAKVESQDCVLDNKEINLEVLFETCKLALHDGLKKKDISLFCNVPKDLPAFYGDKAMLNQAIEGLLASAIKNSPDKGTINITASQEYNHAITITIHDEGKVVKSEFSCKPVYSDETYWKDIATKHLGRGLRLHLSEAIMRKHHGSLVHETNEIKGTTVKLNFAQSSLTPHNSLTP